MPLFTRPPSTASGAGSQQGEGRGEAAGHDQAGSDRDVHEMSMKMRTLNTIIEMSATITIRPEVTTVHPEVRIATAIASVTACPPTLPCPVGDAAGKFLAESADNDQRAVDPDPESDHRRDDRHEPVKVEWHGQQRQYYFVWSRPAVG
jgi:hypothetical protein